MFSKDTYSNRRQRLLEKMNDGIVLIMGNVDSPMNYPDNIYHFRQDSNFLYFFGLDIPQLAGVIDIDNNKEYIFGNDVDMASIIWMGPQVSMKENASKVGVDNTQAFSELFTFIQSAVKQGRKIHFLPPYRAENKLVLEELTGIKAAALGNNVSMELTHAVIALRSIKEPCEMVEIEKACNTGREMHIAAMKHAIEGNTEQYIAGLIEGISISGGSVPSFPIILSQHGETLHNHNHDGILENGKLMLCDAGAETKMRYASDFTRTTPVGGKFTTKQLEIYETVLAANNHATSISKPGIKYYDVHIEACKVIVRNLKAIGLMKGDVDEAVANGAHALFLPHGLGHMMGLDVHDMEDLGQIYVGYDDTIQPSKQFGTAYLRLGRELQEGFVITNEPGIYFIPALIDQWKANKTNADFINFEAVEKYKDFGGIRLEDDLYVGKEKAEIIGTRVPITPFEIESLFS